MTKNSTNFLYIWEYQIKPDKAALFLQYYSSSGKWVELFSKSNGFIKTELVQDIKNATRFITIDYWKSLKHRNLFRKNFSIQFEELDKTCESFTEKEKFIGDFKID